MSWSTPVVVGLATASAVSPRTITYNGIVGRLYILIASRSTAVDPITTVTDSAGNTWTRIHFAPTSGSVGRRIEQWYCIPAVAFTSVSIAFTGAGLCHGVLIETTGQDAGSLINAQAADFRASSTTPAPVNITPTLSDTLLIAGIQWNSNNHVTVVTGPTPGFTRLVTQADGPAAAYLINPTSGVAIGATWTLTGGVAQGSGHTIVTYNMLASAGLLVSVWDGATEITGCTVSVWDGAVETAASVEQVI